MKAWLSFQCHINIAIGEIIGFRFFCRIVYLRGVTCINDSGELVVPAKNVRPQNFKR